MKNGRPVSLGWVAGILLVLASCSSGVETACTLELGVDINPRNVSIAVGEQVRPKIETVTCGGTIRKVPAGLELRSEDPAIASVEPDGRTIMGASTGQTSVEVMTSEYGSIGSISVKVLG